MIPVTTYKTNKIFYDPDQKHFELQDVAGNTLATAQSQDELQHKADLLTKQKLNLPMPALYLSYRHITPGRITSLDMSHGTCYFVPDDKKPGYSKEKLRLGYNHLYARTDHNLQILQQFQDMETQELKLEETRKELSTTLEQELNLDSLIIQDPC